MSAQVIWITKYSVTSYQRYDLINFCHIYGNCTEDGVCSVWYYIVLHHLKVVSLITFAGFYPHSIQQWDQSRGCKRPVNPWFHKPAEINLFTRTWVQFKITRRLYQFKQTTIAKSPKTVAPVLQEVNWRVITCVSDGFSHGLGQFYHARNNDFNKFLFCFAS